MSARDAVRPATRERGGLRPGEIACGFLVVPSGHATRGVTLSVEGSPEGLIAAADALLYEAFKALPMERAAPDGTPLPELHDRARDALRGLLAGLAS